MGRPQKNIEDLHDNLYYPKLTDEYSDKLQLHAAKMDVPPNVLARMLIVKAIDEVELRTESILKKFV